ncbi:MAG: ATP-binding cassette domain-containing protein [Alphaproteobacteria bacterium]
MHKPAILTSVTDLTYAPANTVLVDSISTSFCVDGVSVIMGPNGAGKSLLLRLIAGLIPPDSGALRLTGSLHDGPARVALVAQRPVLLRRSVAANIAFALKVYGVPRSERAAQVTELLALADLEALASRPARLLSGGEQQRLSLVRALAMKPDILLLDEPTANLDPHATAHIESTVKMIAATGVKVIFVTHDKGQAQRLAHEVLFLHRGRLLERTEAETFFTTPETKEARAYLAGELLV